MELGYIFEELTLAVEAAAIAVVILGILIATGQYILRLLRKQSAIESFETYRVSPTRRKTGPTEEFGSDIEWGMQPYDIRAVVEPRAGKTGIDRGLG